MSPFLQQAVVSLLWPVLGPYFGPYFGLTDSLGRLAEMPISKEKERFDHLF